MTASTSAPPRTGATHRLWFHLAQPFDPVAIAGALAGIPHPAARHLVALKVAASSEADQLLARMHETLRSLSVNTSFSPIRCVGDIRGPVLWSETVAARSASPGAADVHVCASPSKAYDTDENRVLLQALLRIRDAARMVEHPAEDDPDAGTVRRARHNGARAIWAIDHRAMATVTRGRITRRGIQRARTGTKARTYRPAVAFLERARQPLTPNDLIPLCDVRTLAQHRVLAAIIHALNEAGRPLPPLRLDNGVLRAGPIAYLHPTRPEPGHGAERDLHGILVGEMLVDVPDPLSTTSAVEAEMALDERSGGRPVLAVLHDGDLQRALRLAVARA